MNEGEAYVGMRVARLREWETKPIEWAYGTVLKVEIFQGQETALVLMDDTGRKESHLTVKLAKEGPDA